MKSGRLLNEKNQISNAKRLETLKALDESAVDRLKNILNEYESLIQKLMSLVKSIFTKETCLVHIACDQNNFNLVHPKIKKSVDGTNKNHRAHLKIEISQIHTIEDDDFIRKPNKQEDQNKNQTYKN